MGTIKNKEYQGISPCIHSFLVCNQTYQTTSHKQKLQKLIYGNAKLTRALIKRQLFCWRRIAACFCQTQSECVLASPHGVYHRQSLLFCGRCGCRRYPGKHKVHRIMCVRCSDCITWKALGAYPVTVRIQVQSTFCSISIFCSNFSSRCFIFINSFALTICPEGVISVWCGFSHV